MWYKSVLKELKLYGKVPIITVDSRVSFEGLPALGDSLVYVVGNRARATVLIPDNAAWSSVTLPWFRQVQKAAFTRVLQDAVAVANKPVGNAAPTGFTIELDCPEWPWFEPAMRLVLQAAADPYAITAAAAVSMKYIAPSYEALLNALFPGAAYIRVTATHALVGAPTLKFESGTCPWSATIARALKNRIKFYRLYAKDNSGYLEVPLPLPPALYSVLAKRAATRLSCTLRRNAASLLPPDSSLFQKVTDIASTEAKTEQAKGGRLAQWCVAHGVSVALVPHNKSLYRSRVREFAALLAAQSKRAAQTDRIAACTSADRDAGGPQCTCPLNRHDGSVWSVCGAFGGDTPVTVALATAKAPPCWAAFTGDKNSRRWDMARMVAKVEYNVRLCNREFGV